MCIYICIYIYIYSEYICVDVPKHTYTYVWDQVWMSIMLKLLCVRSGLLRLAWQSQKLGGCHDRGFLLQKAKRVLSRVPSREPLAER